MKRASMFLKMLSFSIVLLLSMLTIAAGQSVPSRNRICGKWESTTKDLVIQIYTQDGQFKAKLLWYADTEGKPLDYWTDVHNPNPALRNRKLLGMSILKNLTYDTNSNSWENGIVYDSKHGRYWNAAAFIGKRGLLQVRGYWHFKFIGRTMTFKRV